MKRFIAILLAAMLLVGVMPVSAFAATTKTVYISRNGSGQINLRKGPGYDYDVTGNYAYHNSKVTVQESGSKWSKVKVNSTGKTGWIRTYYINGTTKSLGTGTHKITKAATIRSKASSGAASKGKVYVGDTVKVYYTERDYARVKVNGSGSFAGWIPMSVIGGEVSTKDLTPASSGKTVYRVRTNGGNLNVRTGAGTGYGIITSVPNGTALVLQSKSGNWYKVKVLESGVVGWVSRNYTAQDATGWVRTNGGNLNVRSGPGTGSTVRGSLKNGTKVTVKSVSGSWAYITCGSLKGWSSLNYLRF